MKWIKRDKPMPVEISYGEYSYQARLLYMGMKIMYGDGSVCNSLTSLGIDTGLTHEESRHAAIELECGGFVEIWRQPTVVAELRGGEEIWGYTRAMRLTEEMPQVQARLSPAAWGLLRDEIFERDDYTCAYCDERGGCLEVDHVEPVSRGGTNEPGNLVTACRSCNRAKRSKLLDEWRRDA